MEQIGKASLSFHGCSPYILSTASVVGTKEGQGPLGDLFDVIGGDDKFGEVNWEAAESCMQKDALTLALGKGKKKAEEIRYVFAGDLLGQTIASSFGLESFEIPMYGVYGACSTCGETLSLASVFLAGGCGDCIAAVTSSHFASAEKQFRFPLEYANQRPLSATWTVTGSGAFILQRQEPKESVDHVRITGITTGKIVDYGIKDSMNMGAAMAPAACALIEQHLKDFNRKASDYDKIVTGDLGTIGQELLLKLLKERGIDAEGVHEDCGIKIYDGKNQGTGAGGSGCGCSAVTLSAYYYPMLKSGELKRVLFVPTGALLSPVSFNEGQSVPGIAHGLVLEHESNREEEK